VISHVSFCITFDYFTWLNKPIHDRETCLIFVYRYILKMLGLYLVGQNCLHLTFEQYLNSETYSSKYEKLPNIVLLACKNITEKSICWKCLARKFGFIYVSTHCVIQLNGLTTIDTVSWLGGAVVTHPLWVQAVRVQSPNPARVFVSFFTLLLLHVFLFCQKHIICHKSLQFLLQC